MKIGVLLGRGVEGVGLTKNVVEFQKLFPGVEVYALEVLIGIKLVNQQRNFQIY